MFDIGFGELLVIAVLGLLILGPERLPVAIRTISLWVGRFKRSYRQIRTEIEKEIGADDIRRQLHNEEIMQSLNATKNQINRMADDTRAEINKIQDSEHSIGGSRPKADAAEQTTGKQPSRVDSAVGSAIGSAIEKDPAKSSDTP